MSAADSDSLDPFGGLVPFVATAEARSFTAAARTLGVTVSAVSKAVGKLETELGVRLLHRTSRVVTLTSEGEAFLEASREAVDRARAAKALVAGQRTPRGMLRVSLPLPLGRLVLSALPRLLVQYPGLTIQAVITDRSVSLANENIDVAIRIGTLGDSQVVRRPLRVPRFVTVAAPSYLARRGTPQSPAQLAEHDALTFVTTAGRVRPWVFTIDGEPTHVAVRGTLSADHGDAMVAAAIAGAGIIQPLDFMVTTALAKGELVEILSGYAAPGPPMTVLCAPGRQSTPKVRAFMKFAVDLLGPTS